MGLKKEVFLLTGKILILLVFVWVMFTFFFGIVRVNDAGMSPALKEGDLAVYYRLDREYRSGDVVVVNNVPRRVIACAGDSVDIAADGLRINGYVQQEENITEETLPYEEGISFPVQIGEDEVFVLGDNRPYAEDSRNYGPVSGSAVMGQVFAVIRRRNI